MGDALLDVQRLLRSKEVKLSTQELDILRTWKHGAVRSFYVGCAIGGSLTWLATSINKIKLGGFFRLSLTGGAAFVSGMWRFHNHLDSCVDHILSMEGGLMRQELAKVVVQRYHNDPRRMQLISKHFYPEYVWDDTSVDQLKFLYRPRNFYSQYPAYNKSTDDYSADDHSDGKSSENSYQHLLRKDNTASPSVKMANTEARKIHRDPTVSVNTADDPLDFLSGYTSENEESSNRDSSTGARNQSQRRSRRRRRMRHHHQEEESV